MNHNLITRSGHQLQQVNIIDVISGINQATTKQNLNTLNEFHISSYFSLTFILIALFKESAVANRINNVFCAGFLKPVNSILQATAIIVEATKYSKMYRNMENLVNVLGQNG